MFNTAKVFDMQMFKTTKALDHKLNEMILLGQLIPAFDQFYDENVEMIENTDSFKGKSLNHKREEEFVNSIEKVNACELLSEATHGDTTYSEWHMDVTFKGGQRYDLYQVAVRQWKNGKVVKEHFYHKA